MTVVTRQSLHRVVAKLFVRGLLVLLIASVVVALTGWAVLAIYYGDSHTSLLQTVLALGFGLVGCTTLLGIWSKRWRRATSAEMDRIRRVVTDGSKNDWRGRYF